VATTIGNTRRIDHLGRIVVPAVLRRSLGIHEGDEFEITERDGEVTLRKMGEQCVVCLGTEDLVLLRNKYLCRDCVRAIRVS
jgi:AbrB family transcriptional regulator, transcriptional pleiotropic regulator of transition state genes